MPFPEVKRVIYKKNPLAYSLIRPAWNVIRQTPNHAIAETSRKILLVIQETITDFQHLKFDLGEIGASGYLKRVDIKTLVLCLINFIISHS